jgi:predicted metal-dependent phosphoesterase TrpH
MRFDLQSHSTCSDGALAPAEVVRAAAAAGVELLALTDHDTVEGVPAAQEAARAGGVGLVPAAELSAVWGGHEDLHVLGYDLDHGDPGLLARLGDARADRARRAERMGERLRELGWALDEAPLEARRAAGRPVGRPHLAAAVVDAPENAERLAAEGLDTPSALLEAYLIPRRPAYLPRTRPTVPEAIGWIHDAGGVAVWAHPFWDLADPGTVVSAIDAFRADGLDGVEVFYPTHSREQTLLLAGACGERRLLQTGSADFHGPEHPHFAAFGAFELYGREPVLGPLARYAP